MKRRYILLWCILATHLVLALVLLFLMPSVVPVTYGFSGRVIRMGSRMEYLLAPVISLIFTTLLTLVARNEGKKQDERAERFILTFALCGVIGFLAFGTLFEFLALFH